MYFFLSFFSSTSNCCLLVALIRCEQICTKSLVVTRYVLIYLIKNSSQPKGKSIFILEISKWGECTTYNNTCTREWRKKKFLSILGVDDHHGESQAKAKLWRAERLLIRMESKKNKTRKASICRRISERQKWSE